MRLSEQEQLQELRWAQKEVFDAANHFVSAGLRLQGTKYEKSYDRLYKGLNSMNRKLIADINKRRK